MRITALQLSRVLAGYVLVADIIGSDEAEIHIAGDRQEYAALLADISGRPEVLQVHSRRLAPLHTVGQAMPTAAIAEDFGTMAGYLWSGDEFAIGREDGE